MKTIFTCICIFFVFKFAKAQHVIFTKTDTIEAHIISLDDSVYTYKRLNKPRIVKTIDKSLVVRLLPLGDDTLFDISQTINSKIEVIKSLFNDTWVEISDTKEGIKITTSSKVRGKLRRQVASFEYVLDGMTALTMQSPLGPVSMTASIDGVALVHIVNTPKGIETHRRQAVKSPKGDRLMQTMIDAKGNNSTLEYQRIK